MISFPAISLPANILRRSWVVEQMQGLRYGIAWHGMLKRLAPSEAAKVSPRNARACHGALWHYINHNLFPLFELVDYYEEDDPEYSQVDYLWDHGIPCDVMGVDEELVSDVNGPTCETLLIALVEGDDGLLKDNKVLSPCRARLMPFMARQVVGRIAKPARGRQWREQWGTLGLFVDYCRSNTGLAFFDWSHYAIQDGGEYPRWNMDEINGLAADWKKAKPLHERINAFCHYIEAKPDERLPLLAGALVGDAATLERITEPKPRAGKTLAQIFSGKRK